MKNYNWLRRIVYGATLLLSSVVNAATPFIIDTDVGDDDAIAILYFLQNPQVHVKAITIETKGDARCTPAFHNVEGMVELLGRGSLPVACGVEASPPAGHEFPAWLAKKQDTLSGTANLLPATQTPVSHNAVALLIDTINHSPDGVNILAIGPLTNIAEAYQRDPRIKNKIRMIYAMAGAVHVPGNIRSVVPDSTNEVAEWNIYFDPLAAKIVFANLPITLVPLDITNQAQLDWNFYQQLKHQHHTAAANYLYQLLQHNEKGLRNGLWYFWDPMAAVVAANQSYFTFTHERLRVAAQSGGIVVDQHGRLVTVCNGYDKKAFEQHLIFTLNQPNPVAFDKPVVNR